MRKGTKKNSLYKPSARNLRFSAGFSPGGRSFRPARLPLPGARTPRKADVPLTVAHQRVACGGIGKVAHPHRIAHPGPDERSRAADLAFVALAADVIGVGEIPHILMADRPAAVTPGPGAVLHAACERRGQHSPGLDSLRGQTPADVCKVQHTPAQQGRGTDGNRSDSFRACFHDTDETFFRMEISPDVNEVIPVSSLMVEFKEGMPLCRQPERGIYTFRSACVAISIPHCAMSSTMGSTDLPASVNSYSTLGGTTG